MVPSSDKPAHNSAPRISPQKWNQVIGTVHKRDRIPPIVLAFEQSEGLVQSNIAGIQDTADGVNVGQNLLILWGLDIDSRCGSGC